MFTNCSNLLSCYCGKHHNHKRVGKEEVDLASLSRSQFIIEGSQEGAQAGTQTEITEECCLLAHSQARAQLAFLISTGHREWCRPWWPGPPSSITNQDSLL